ncbi:MAG: hypothetical protein IKK57_04335 [Clostridia bacterium]|nr:hypothetical protein [Clostridia bacterium]
MSAYEIFCQDVKDDELKRGSTSRQRYYSVLREALKNEVAAGGRCELLHHYAKRLDKDGPAYMYLLDAAALWECYDAVFCSRRFPRPLGEGFPFPMQDGRRLPWQEVERLSNMQALPVAVVDAQLRSRLESLCRYAGASLQERKLILPGEVDERAHLKLAPAAEAARAAVPEKDGEADASEEVLRLREQLAQALAECGTLREAVKQAKSRPQTEDEESVVDLLLKNRLAEAAGRLQAVNGELAEKARLLQSMEHDVEDARARLQETARRLREDEEEAEKCRRSQQEVDEAAARAAEACEQARRDAARARQEKQAAEDELASTLHELSRVNDEVQAARRRLCEAKGALEMTGRQHKALT